MTTAVGIDLGGTKIQTVVIADTTTGERPRDFIAAADGGEYTGPVGGGWEATGHGRVLTPEEATPEAIADAVAEAVGMAGPQGARCAGIGFAGPVDHQSGRVARAPNLRGFGEDVPIAAMVSDRLGIPVFLENDVNAALYGEWKIGAAAGHDDVLGVWWGTGVGGAWVLDGAMRRGPHGYSGEIGHIVVHAGGRKPPAGITGSMESYAGRAAMEATARHWQAEKGHKTKLFEIMEAKGKDRLTSGVWHKAWAKHDRTARELIDEAQTMLGVGIASLVNAVDVSLVVLGGGMSDRFGDEIVDPVRDEMRRNLIAPHVAPALERGVLGDLCGALGAALAGLDSALMRAAVPSGTR